MAKMDWSVMQTADSDTADLDKAFVLKAMVSRATMYGGATMVEIAKEALNEAKGVPPLSDVRKPMERWARMCRIVARESCGACNGFGQYMAADAENGPDFDELEICEQCVSGKALAYRNGRMEAAAQLEAGTF